MADESAGLFGRKLTQYSLRFMVQRHARQLDLLVSTHRLLAGRPASPADTDANQLTLF